jgi:hypothetical protein
MCIVGEFCDYLSGSLSDHRVWLDTIRIPLPRCDFPASDLDLAQIDLFPEKNSVRLENALVNVDVPEASHRSRHSSDRIGLLGSPSGETENPAHTRKVLRRARSSRTQIAVVEVFGGHQPEFRG